MQENDMGVYERFIHNKWRPAIGWLYFITVLFDFVLAPSGFAAVQYLQGVVPLVQWEPLTLKGSAMFHVSMLTIVGVTAYGRTKEKLEGVATDLNNKIGEALRGKQ